MAVNCGAGRGCTHVATCNSSQQPPVQETWTGSVELRAPRSLSRQNGQCISVRVLCLALGQYLRCESVNSPTLPRTDKVYCRRTVSRRWRTTLTDELMETRRVSLEVGLIPDTIVLDRGTSPLLDDRPNRSTACRKGQGRLRMGRACNVHLGLFIAYRNIRRRNSPGNRIREIQRTTSNSSIRSCYQSSRTISQSAWRSEAFPPYVLMIVTTPSTVNFKANSPEARVRTSIRSFRPLKTIMSEYPDMYPCTWIQNTR